ncbi:hypothetical protein KIN20_035058 [Parelaphostrongylus tenuis]|uniref:Uncharacterized protein n=1 Tax=Parelaphostrongylus tenuis TaxID=148309 RepID=A0AAD5RAK6_PARTN|nr:hypothetical protein KIN20_035058 [Parelaphostrongylus tenuis]
MSRQTDEDILDKILPSYVWQIKDDSTEDYDLLVERLRCADLTSLTQPRRADRISPTTKELLEKRTKVKLDPNATHSARLISNTRCRRALQEDLHRYRQMKLLKAAQERSSLKKSPESV